MPVTIPASNGEQIHLWQLTCNSKETTEGIEFTTLTNELSDGYWSQILYGSNTGVRRWNITLPTLTGSSTDTVTSITGATVTREQYLWDLFCETQVTGRPFAYQSPRNDQYYLVRFADHRLSYQRMLTKLYSTGIELMQVRVSGLSVFDVSESNVASYGYFHFDETGHVGGEWRDKNFATTNKKLVPTGDVTFGAAQQNGLDIVRFNSSANTGFLTAPATLDLAFDVFLVMKMREAVFSNDAGILSDTGNAASALEGDSTETTFADLGLGVTYRYWLNGQEFDHDAQLAPMDTWGVVQIRFPAGLFEIDQIGKKLAVAGTFAEMDMGELLTFTQYVPLNDARELTEHLMVKWNTGS